MECGNKQLSITGPIIEKVHCLPGGTSFESDIVLAAIFRQSRTDCNPPVISGADKESGSLGQRYAGQIIQIDPVSFLAPPVSDYFPAVDNQVRSISMAIYDHPPELVMRNNHNLPLHII